MEWTIVNAGQYHTISVQLFLGTRSNGDNIYLSVADSHGSAGEYPKYGYSFDSTSTNDIRDAGQFTTFRIKIQRVGNVWTISSPDGDGGDVTVTPSSGQQLLSQIKIHSNRIFWAGNTSEASITVTSLTNDFLFSPDMPEGTIFEESDTGKHYMFDGTSTWNEM